MNTAPFDQIFGYQGPTEEEYENNVHSFLLVDGYTGSATGGNGVGDDLDTDDNGTFDVFPWAGVVDAISVAEAGDPGFQYAAQVGGLDIAAHFGADLWARIPVTDPLFVAGTNEWLFFDSSSGDGEPAGFQGPFCANDGAGVPGDTDAAYQNGTVIVVSETSTFLYATPGAGNLNGVPEPAAATLLLLGSLGGLLWRCR